MPRLVVLLGLLLLAGKAAGDGDGGTIEWSAAYNLTGTSSATWRMQRFDGKYDRLSTRLVVIPTYSATVDLSGSLETEASNLMQGTCEVVNASGSMTPAAGGSCFELTVNDAPGDDPTFNLDTTGLPGMAVFADHGVHYLRNDDHEAVRPAVRPVAGLFGNFGWSYRPERDYAFSRSGAFQVGDSVSLVWRMQKVDGKYAHESMKLVIIPTTKSLTEATAQTLLNSSSSRANALMEGPCTVMNAGVDEEAVVYGGSCFNLTVNSTKEYSTFFLDTSGYSSSGAGMLVYAEHDPTKFVRDLCLQTSDGHCIEPTEYERPSFTDDVKVPDEDIKWAGLFDVTNKSSLTWSFPADLDGASPKVVIFPVDSPLVALQHPCHEYRVMPNEGAMKQRIQSGAALRKMRGKCEEVKDGVAIPAMTVQSASLEGVCFNSSSFTLDATGLRGLAVFLDHVPINYPDTYYIQDSNDKYIEPVAQEGGRAFKWVGVYNVTGDDQFMKVADKTWQKLVIIPAVNLTQLAKDAWEDDVANLAQLAFGRFDPWAEDRSDMIKSYSTYANDLMEGPCPEVINGRSVTPPEEGSCFAVTPGAMFYMNTTGFGAIAVFTQHVPTKFEGISLHSGSIHSADNNEIDPVRDFTVDSWKAPFDKAAMWLGKKINKPFFFSGDGVLALLLGIVGTVILAFTVTVLVSGEPEPEPEPTFWEKLKCTLSDVTKCDKFKFDFFFGRRGEPVTMNVNTDNSAEAYQVLQAFSATSGDTITTMLVSQLQAANYTGAMPTMITTVLNSVTDGGSSSGSSSDSNTTMIAVAIVVAAALVLLAVLVVSALVYMYKLNKDQAPAAQTGAAPAPPVMGSVGVSMNPMHANEAKTPTAYTA